MSSCENREQSWLWTGNSFTWSTHMHGTLRVNTESPNCLLSNHHRSLRKCCLMISWFRSPTCSPRLLRMLDSSMVQNQTYHDFLPVHIHAALPRSSLLLPPSLRVKLIFAAAKHLHQNLSDWSEAVSWQLPLFLSSGTSGGKEERERRSHRGRRRITSAVLI